MTIITGAENIENVRILALRGALRMEARGMKRRGRSALAIVREMGLTDKRTASAALTDLNAYIAANILP
jgi:hypothetical protein